MVFVRRLCSQREPRNGFAFQHGSECALRRDGLVRDRRWWREQRRLEQERSRKGSGRFELRDGFVQRGSRKRAALDSKAERPRRKRSTKNGPRKRNGLRKSFDEEAGISREHGVRKDRYASARASTEVRVGADVERRRRRYGVSKETVSVFESKEENIKRNLEAGSDRCGLRKELPSVRGLSGFEKIWVSQEIRIERNRRGSCHSFFPERAPSRKRRSRSVKKMSSKESERTRSKTRASKGASCPRADEPQ